MKKILIITLFLSITGAAFAAEPSKYEIDVKNFTELVVVDGVPVDYYSHPDSAGIAVFACAPELVSEILFSNNGNRLSIRSGADESPIEGLPRVRVYSKSLEKIENSGDSLVRAYMSLPVTKFSAKQIDNGTLEVHNVVADKLEAAVTAGKGTIILNGSAKSAKFRNMSSGPLNAAGLETGTVGCSIFGSGNIECSPAESLTVYGVGRGKVIYHGSPKISKRSMGVKAIAADAKE